MKLSVIYLGDTKTLPSYLFYRRFHRHFPDIQSMPDDGLTHTLYVVGDLSFVAALEMIQPHATLIAHQDHERDTMALMIDKGRRQQIAEDVWQEALPGIPILPDFEAISAWLAGNYTS